MTFPAYFAARRSTTGSIALHGGHQTAQKSTKTGRPSFTYLSKSEAVSVTIDACLEEASVAILFAFSSRSFVSSGSDNIFMSTQKGYFKILGVCGLLADSFDARLVAIAQGLGGDEPIPLAARKTAAVAVAIRDGPHGEEVLLIRRAVREGDPWSGDVAFPGGRVEAVDGSFRDAALREAREEVGADLAADARFLGYMGPFQARRRGIWVVPCVFAITRDVTLDGSDEVAAHMWVPLREFRASENRSTYVLELGGERRTFPSYNVQGVMVWGLTERILTSLVERLPGEAGQFTSRRTS